VNALFYKYLDASRRKFRKYISRTAVYWFYVVSMRTDDLNAVDWLALLLAIIGAINWGLVGLGMVMDSNWNLVTQLFGSFPTLEAIIYLLVGAAGLYLLWTLYKLGADGDDDWD
jgi:uncharacterized membrane protein YuzA (DUF378 family)